MSSRTFLKIGDFARVCHTTKETLLHYDRKGVLKPGYVSDNGYRWYALKQFFDFDLILLLKETGSTLEEIKRYRNAGRRDGYLELFRESIAVLEKEQERIAGRLSMLNNLVVMLLQKMELGDFFGLTTFLTEINLLRPTKVEN